MDHFTIKDLVDDQSAIISLSRELSVQEQPAHFELSHICRINSNIKVYQNTTSERQISIKIIIGKIVSNLRLSKLTIIYNKMNHELSFCSLVVDFLFRWYVCPKKTVIWQLKGFYQLCWVTDVKKNCWLPCKSWTWNLHQCYLQRDRRGG